MKIQATDDELIAEREAMRLALGATLGTPHDGREEHKNASLRSQIEAIDAELDRRHSSP
jgi:hypothetical protein